jgi:NAD(P)-dependent dehydrogenase (short-subunit alcohol dehydrogenase family)
LNCEVTAATQDLTMLNEKIIVVTGGAGLIGKAFCEEIAECGGCPIVADINLESAERVAAAIRANGQRAEATPLDITCKDSILALIDRTSTRHGRIDAVVNNAYPRNFAYGRKLEDVTYDDFCDNVGLHLGGYFLVAQQFAIYFRSCDGGTIVNMGSIYGSIAPRFDIYANTPMTMPVEYAAIKSGIANLTRYFAQHYKKYGVRVNTLSPGGIFNAQPAPFLEKYRAFCGTKGMLDRRDIAGTLVYLLSDASQYVTGQEIVVDDGFSL